MKLEKLDADRVETALTRLAESDDLEAEQSVAVEEAETNLKRIFSIEFLNANGSVAEREAKARTSHGYELECFTYAEVKTNHLKTRNMRKHEELVIEVWRTLEASRRKA